MPGQRFDLAADNVHADTTSGDICNLISRRETWQENQANRIGIVQLIGLFLSDHALLDRFLTDDIRIDASTIIRNHNDNVIAFMAGNEPNFTSTWLAFRFTIIRVFNTMIV